MSQFDEEKLYVDQLDRLVTIMFVYQSTWRAAIGYHHFWLLGLVVRFGGSKHISPFTPLHRSVILTDILAIIHIYI